MTRLHKTNWPVHYTAYRIYTIINMRNNTYYMTVQIFQQHTLCLRKDLPTSMCNWRKHWPILIIFDRNVRKKFSTQSWIIFSVSRDITVNTEIASFHLNVECASVTGTNTMTLHHSFFRTTLHLHKQAWLHNFYVTVTVCQKLKLDSACSS